MNKKTLLTIALILTILVLILAVVSYLFIQKEKIVSSEAEVLGKFVVETVVYNFYPEKKEVKKEYFIKIKYLEKELVLQVASKDFWGYKKGQKFIYVSMQKEYLWKCLLLKKE